MTADYREPAVIRTGIRVLVLDRAALDLTAELRSAGHTPTVAEYQRYCAQMRHYAAFGRRHPITNEPPKTAA